MNAETNISVIKRYELHTQVKNKKSMYLHTQLNGLRLIRYCTFPRFVSQYSIYDYFYCVIFIVPIEICLSIRKHISSTLQLIVRFEQLRVGASIYYIDQLFSSVDIDQCLGILAPPEINLKPFFVQLLVFVNQCEIQLIFAQQQQRRRKAKRKTHRGRRNAQCPDILNIYSINIHLYQTALSTVHCM